MGRYLIKIFVVEDEPVFGQAVKRALEKVEHYDVHLFSEAQETLDQLHQNPDLVVMDHHLPGMSGLKAVEQIKRYNEEIACVMLSGQETAEVVVQAYKAGVKDYILKNQTAIHDLLNSVQNLTHNVELRKEVEELRERIIDRERYSNIVGESPAVLKVLRLMQKVEKTNMLVLITGESGTGKEVVASAIHYNSPRKRQPYVAVNMAAIPEDLVQSELFGHEKGSFTGADSRRLGKFEEAHKGTIFLDEIGEMDVQMQAQLLRVLQESKITRVGSNKEIPLDVRVLAATNRNLAQMVEEGKFRADLYYRLQGFLLHLPPLRERGNDIILLAKFFLNDFLKKNGLGRKTFSKSVIERMMSYHWPGNVRELKSLVERAAIIADTDQIEEEDLIFSSGDIPV